MRVPRRHRFAAPAPPAQLFAQLPPGRRFRFASGASAATAFGAEPVAVLEMEALRALDFEPLRAMLPRVPVATRDAFPGGAVGFLPYEAGFANERLVEGLRLSRRPFDRIEGVELSENQRVALLLPSFAEPLFGEAGDELPLHRGSGEAQGLESAVDIHLEKRIASRRGSVPETGQAPLKGVARRLPPAHGMDR